MVVHFNIFWGESDSFQSLTVPTTDGEGKCEAFGRMGPSVPIVNEEGRDGEYS